MGLFRKIVSPSRNDYPKPTPYNDQRFNKFSKTFESLLELWKSSDFSHIAFKVPIIQHIQLLTDILVNEERITSTTGPIVLNSQPVNNPCMHFAIQKSVFPNLAQIAQQSSDEICQQVLKSFVVITEMDDDELLNDPSVIASLKGLLLFIATSKNNRQSLQLITCIGEILQGSEIRILYTWFDEETLVFQIGNTTNSSGYISPNPSLRSGASAINKLKHLNDDCIIIYLLLDLVCAEGEVGSFARTGLLLLIEAAAAWKPLELWLANDSDMGILMSCGLGALYSQLGSKLVIDYCNKNNIPELLVPEKARMDSETESSQSPNFLLRLGEFLTYLAFWQDVLSNCPSNLIRKSLLIQFEQFFLAQLLYPSLVDSLDLEAPSAVAILTYVRALLENLQHPEIVEVIINYLFGQQLQKTSHTRRDTKDFLSMIEHEDFRGLEDMAPSLYSLGDVIVANLDSKSPQINVATLQLVSTLLRKDCYLVYSRLLRIVRIPDEAAYESATIGRHVKEMELLLALTDVLQVSTHSYASYLKDTLLALQIHPCHIEAHLFPDDGSKSEHCKSTAYHSIKADSSLLKGLLRLFTTFLENTVDVNLILTRVVVDLASCRYRKLDGWLLFGTDETWVESCKDDDEFAAQISDKYTQVKESSSDTESLDYETFHSTERTQQKCVWKKLPPFLAVFRALSVRIQQYQSEVEELTKLLDERWKLYESGNNCGSVHEHSLPTRSPNLLKHVPTTRYFVTAIKGFSSPIRKSKVEPSTPSAQETSCVVPNSTASTENSPLPVHIAHTTRRIQVLSPIQMSKDISFSFGQGRSDDGDIFMAATKNELTEKLAYISISHLLNNIIIFQEFIKELMAVIQNRRALYEGVTYL